MALLQDHQSSHIKHILDTYRPISPFFFHTNREKEPYLITQQKKSMTQIKNKTMNRIRYHHQKKKNLNQKACQVRRNWLARPSITHPYHAMTPWCTIQRRREKGKKRREERKQKETWTVSNLNQSVTPQIKLLTSMLDDGAALCTDRLASRDMRSLLSI